MAQILRTADICPAGYNAAGAGVEGCRNNHKSLGIICTRPLGHSGVHHAHDVRSCCKGVNTWSADTSFAKSCPSYFPMPSMASYLCGQQNKNGEDSYCNREPGHVGQHHSHADGECLATWGKIEQAPEPQKGELVFAVCGTCKKDIYRRLHKRKIINGEWHHIECIAPDAPSDILKQLAETMAAQAGALSIEDVEAVVKKTLDDTKFDHIEDLISKRIRESRPLVIEVKQAEKEPIKIENVHERLPDLLYHVNKREHVYLWGPPGSGKSTAARQVADSLGLSYGFISLNPQTPESRIIGFLDATGTYRPSPFYNCYKDGGVFCIDEMDNSSPALLTTLNSLLENGHGAFPCGIIPRHKDFVLVSAGNTTGRGANAAFPDRRPFDAAFSERFVYLEWGYDKKLEQNIALGINPDCQKWIDYVWQLRDYCAAAYPRLVISPRAIFKGASCLKDGIKIEETLERVLFKGFDRDSVAKILKANPCEGVAK